VAGAGGWRRDAAAKVFEKRLRLVGGRDAGFLAMRAGRGGGVLGTVRRAGGTRSQGGEIDWPSGNGPLGCAPRAGRYGSRRIGIGKGVRESGG
jgi:hypothetical protein